MVLAVSPRCEPRFDGPRTFSRSGDGEYYMTPPSVETSAFAIYSTLKGPAIKYFLYSQSIILSIVFSESYPALKSRGLTFPK